MECRKHVIYGERDLWRGLDGGHIFARDLRILQIMRRSKMWIEA